MVAAIRSGARPISSDILAFGKRKGRFGIRGLGREIFPNKTTCQNDDAGLKKFHAREDCFYFYERVKDYATRPPTLLESFAGQVPWGTKKKIESRVAM
jgi:hypothetical protein